MTGLTLSFLSTMKILKKVSSFWKLIALVLPFISTLVRPTRMAKREQVVVEVKRKDSWGLTVCFYGTEYDDDTSIIPRSTSVIARRLPASRPGKGGAARYVSGKMPVNARSAPRNEQFPLTRASPNTSNGVLELNNAQTEEEKINALFNLQANQWKEQQQEMAK